MSLFWRRLTPVALMLGLTMDIVGVAGLVTDGVAVIGEVKLHGAELILAGAVLTGLAWPGTWRWWVSKEEAKRKSCIQEMDRVIATIQKFTQGINARSVDQKTTAEVDVMHEVNPAWFPIPMKLNLALARAHRFRERFERMSYRKAMRLIRSEIKSQPELT